MVQPKRFLREPLEGELVPSLQEGELVPSLQEEEIISLQEGEDVLVPAVPVHHASPVKADMQDEETSRYYNVFLHERLGQEQNNLFVPVPLCVLVTYNAPGPSYIKGPPFISPFPFVGYREKFRPFPFVGYRVKFFKFHASPTAAKKMFEPLVPFYKVALIWELFEVTENEIEVSLRSELTSTDSSSLSFPSVGKPESMPWRVPWSMP